MTPTHDKDLHFDIIFCGLLNNLTQSNPYIVWSAQVVMTEYVAGCGDGFKIIAENKEKHLQVTH